MSKQKRLNLFFFFLLNIITISESQFLNKNVLKAAGCVTLVKKLKDKPNDKRVQTALLLTCYINIEEETAEILLQNQNYDKIGIEENEIQKLIDFNLIQRKYNNEQLEQYSKELNAALEPLKDKGKEDNSRKDFDTHDYKQENSENEFGFISYLIKLFTSIDSFLLLFGLFIIFYFCLQKMRKFFRKSDKSNNNLINNKKTSKSSKKKKK